MATVYLAVQESLARYVALKVMNKLLTMDAEFCRRFLNEGRLIAKLAHAHIVTVYDIGAVEDTHYLSMAYLSGGDLREKLRVGLQVDQAVTILRCLADALGYAHKHSIVHRDIKPSNVLFTDSGKPVLTDFGIAKTVGDETKLTATGMLLGSAGYMSPEQAAGKKIDNRSDLYSLGVLFWEMLNGALPYEARDPFALALKHANDPIPQLPSRLRQFEHVFEGLLAKKPEDRLSSAEDLIRMIDAIPSDNGRPAPPSAQDETLLLPPKPEPSVSPGDLTKPNLDPSTSPKRGVLIPISLIAVIALAGIWGVLGYRHLFTPAPEPDQASAVTPSPATEPAGSDSRQANRTTVPQTAKSRQTPEPSSKKKGTNGEAATLSRTNQAQSSQPQETSARNENQRDIGRLLRQAEQQWNAGRLTQPSGDNAFETYSRVLELDREQAVAKGRLVQIGRINAANRVFESADVLLREGRIDDARRMIETGLRMNPDDERLLGLLRALDF